MDVRECGLRKVLARVRLRMCVEGAWVGVGISFVVRRCGLGRCAGLGEETGVDVQGLRARMLRGAVPESRTYKSRT